jgi:hypothetical protein
MAARALAPGLRPSLDAAALAVAVCVAAVGCGGDSSPGSATVTIPQVGLTVHVPGSLADLTYALGASEEGQPAVYFSTERLASVGGPSCAAGASAAVSPYPLGQIVVSDETPGHVRREARANPEENLGEFVKRVGDSFLYYVAPPEEPCVSGDREAVDLQRTLTAELKDALSTLRPIR